MDNDTYQIGEAKTCEDLESEKTREQFEDFANAVINKIGSEREFIPFCIAVPKMYEKIRTSNQRMWIISKWKYSTIRFLINFNSKIPFGWDFCNNFIICLGIESDALFTFYANSSRTYKITFTNYNII